MNEVPLRLQDDGAAVLPREAGRGEHFIGRVHGITPTGKRAVRSASDALLRHEFTVSQVRALSLAVVSHLSEPMPNQAGGRDDG